MLAGHSLPRPLGSTPGLLQLLAAHAFVGSGPQHCLPSVTGTLAVGVRVCPEYPGRSPLEVLHLVTLSQIRSHSQVLRGKIFGSGPAVQPTADASLR